MKHDQARAIFEDIRARPYGVAEVQGAACHNCYYKGIELLQRLGILGYAVRGRIGEVDWRELPLPPEVLGLVPDGMDSTHFWVEVCEDGVWRALDASFQPGLAVRGLRIGEWDNGATCFTITKLYSQEEVAAYFDKWADPALEAAEFARAGAFFRAVNRWFGEGEGVEKPYR